MTEKEMLNFIEEKIKPMPDRFSDMTLQEAKQFKEDFYIQIRIRKAENRKKQIFERLLKKKHRQLLVV